MVRQCARPRSPKRQTAGTSQTAARVLIDQMEEMVHARGHPAEHREAFIDVIDAFAAAGECGSSARCERFYPRLAELPKLAALKEGTGHTT